MTPASMKPYMCCKAFVELYAAAPLATLGRDVQAGLLTTAQQARTISNSSAATTSSSLTSQATPKPSEDQASSVKRINLMTAVNEALSHSLEDRRYTLPHT